ncbi:MAG: UDP-N-acetylglucosamine-1-phosphate transferase [Nitrosopumilus sp.]|nr:UDP-N-acetylglucosamine-1-phosphate transferase [Nitrosopumilus sp.]CAI9832353.1 UDP-N-acetylglucosamine-1-phosphate transferase [Nitrosopumilaceae archaeon]MDA7942020.1 UDP-N-acetylglucosamine-1-phosphate transferase [Nitrosopumilus sp.]MDA7944069.1 UDP-N-acetylglucosamine-1-phosphate transferase [Nitrosopumilus sp.]MDA7945583.1 UDP-N-acetylglucosamine-1-phosphate transferase [Nitrosopumilus sp.]
MIEGWHAAAAAALAACTVLFMVPPLARLLESRGMTVPDAHKKSRVMVPMPAGPALAAGIISAELLLYLLHPSPGILAAAAATAAAFAAGMVDDLRPMSGWFKPGMLALAALPLLLLGAYGPDLAFPPFGSVHIPLLYPALVVMMVVVAGNAANSIDVLNGVLSGLMAMCGAALAISLLIMGRPDAAAAAVPIAAAAAAYYRYHRLPTRIFPGDSGALALGAAYAAVAVYGGAEVVAAVILLPAIANSFFFLSSTRRIVEFKRTRRPVEMTPDRGRLRATADRLAPVTLVRLLLAGGPLTEAQVAGRILRLGAFSCALGIATAVMAAVI